MWALAGCESSPYRCGPSRACNEGSVCAADGYCAEPVSVTVCASGYRYSSSAATPGACVRIASDATPDATDEPPPDDALDASDASDATDALDAIDALDASDASDATDDVPDALDAADATDVLDVLDVPDVRDATDARDVTSDLAMDLPPADAPVDAPRDAIEDRPPPPRCVVAPRPIVPLAGTRLAASTVTLAWRNAVIADRTEVWVSPDPSFRTSVTTIPVAGGSTLEGRTAAAGLARGVYFWRVRSVCGASDVSDWSPTWSFWASGAGASQSPLGWVPDLDADGVADFAVGFPHDLSPPTVGRSVTVFFGAPGQTPFGRGRSTGISGSPEGFGSAVAIVPDMNGDGAAELVIGSCQRSGPLCTPIVYVFTYGPGAAAARLLAAYSIGDVASRFGADLAGAGDLDRDGYGDLLIAAPGTFPTPEGVLHVVRGGPTLPSVTTPRTLTTPPPSGPAATRYTWSLAAVGDVTGDAIADAVVTSFERAWVFPGTNGSPAVFSVPVLLGLTATEEGAYGFNAATGGDLDGDGLADFVLARPGARGGLGDVNVYLGGAALFMGATPAQVITGSIAGGRFGEAVAGGGSVVGDARDDVLVGAPGANTGAGEVYVLIGGATVLASRLAHLSSETSPGALGRAASVIGDFDRDGFDDFAFSAGAGSGSTAQSAVYTWHGTNMPVPPQWTSSAIMAAPYYGYSIGGR